MSKKKLSDRKVWVWERDNYTCVYCGTKVIPRTSTPGVRMPNNTATVDHIVPKSEGGRYNKDNLVTSCLLCNLMFKSKFNSVDQRIEYLAWEKAQTRKAMRKAR